MIRVFFLLSCIAAAMVLDAQDRSVGQITDLASYVGRQVSFTETTTESSTDYVTTYSVYNAQNELEYQISSTHPKGGNQLSFTNYHQGMRQTFDMAFDPAETGLIINKEKKFDTVFTDPSKPYELLVSFQDTGYTFAYINKIVDDDKQMIELDKLSGLLIRKNKQLIAQRLAAITPVFDSAAYYKRIEEEKQALKKKLQEEEARRQEEEKKRIAFEKAEAERKHLEQVRKTYYEKYAANSFRAEAVGQAYKIDSIVKSYFFYQDCKHINVGISLLISIDTLGAVTLVYASNSDDVESLSGNSMEFYNNICHQIRNLRLKPAIKDIDGYSWPVHSKMTYYLSAEGKIETARYHFDDNNKLLDADDHAVSDDFKADFLRIHEGNKFSSSKFKIRFCAATIGSKTTYRIIDIEDLEHNPNAPRQIYKNLPDGK